MYNTNASNKQLKELPYPPSYVFKVYLQSSLPDFLHGYTGLHEVAVT